MKSKRLVIQIAIVECEKCGADTIVDRKNVSCDITVPLDGDAVALAVAKVAELLK